MALGHDKDWLEPTRSKMVEDSTSSRRTVSGRRPQVVTGNPLQNSRLENPMDRGTWRAIVYGAL